MYKARDEQHDSQVAVHYQCSGPKACYTAQKTVYSSKTDEKTRWNESGCCAFNRTRKLILLTYGLFRQDQNPQAIIVFAIIA